MLNFRPGWLLTVFVAVFLPVFIGLGSWQLNRAEQKAQLSAQLEAGRAVQDLPAGSVPTLYQHYQLKGRLDGRHLWLLDNRTYQGQAGYELWVPMITDQGWYLVSAGWVAGTGDRQQLPQPVVPKAKQPWLAQGRPLSQTVVLAETTSVSTWPQLLQTLDPKAMAEQLGWDEPLGLLQLSAGQPGVGPVIWTPTVMTAERHRGYAVQWFAMAVALLLMYIYAGWRVSASSQPSEHEDDT